MGQYYCLHCDRYFADLSTRDEHFKTKRHKKRLKEMMGTKPHTQLDADLAAGMGMPDNGPKLMSIKGKPMFINFNICGPVETGSVLGDVYYGGRLALIKPNYFIGLKLKVVCEDPALVIGWVHQDWESDPSSMMLGRWPESRRMSHNVEDTAFGVEYAP
ncbi:hypothetical protein Pint_35701 [Pistacia integerrima]|uniref:Uncharacterized protein n=1 Tax=Pistacia integerrima TaxID=434235 RepID=A0ACC0XYE2_9ROSI|nr:hypothetical protein Pint_35701 [Pistacia integerrima]